MMDREKVIKGLETIKQFFGYGLPSTAEMFDSYYGILNDALALLKEQEAVVRCKDCVKCVKEPNGDLYCDVLAIGYEPLGSKRVSADWFCADGERW